MGIVTRAIPEEKRSKYRKIKAVTAVLTIAAIVAAFIYMNLYSVSDELAVGLDGAELYFGETTARAKRDVGAPTEKLESDGYTVYKYEGVELFGVSASAELKFRDGRLKEVASTLAKPDGADLFEAVITELTEVYKSREDFFATDKETYSVSGYCRISGKAEGAELVCDIYDKEDFVMIVTRAGN